MSGERKSLPTLIRELREAAFAAGVAEGSWQGQPGELKESQEAYGAAIEAVIERLDELGLR